MTLRLVLLLQIIIVVRSLSLRVKHSKGCHLSGKRRKQSRYMKIKFPRWSFETAYNIHCDVFFIHTNKVFNKLQTLSHTIFTPLSKMERIFLYKKKNRRHQKTR